jgi:circadian clock protein KaiC
MHMQNDVLTGVTSGLADPELAKAPTGILGLDQITGGGLPLGRVTLVTGSAGAGKTLLGVEFLVSGARKYREPGVLVTFEESAAKVTANVRSLGFDLEALQRVGMLVVLSFQVDPAEIVTSGEFDFEPLFMLIDEAIARIGAKRVVLDTIEVLFGAFGDEAIVRGEVSRLARWLEERGVTAVVTGERGSNGVSALGIEEFVSDCVIALDHRVQDEISTRRLRIVKYRGSAHGTNEYPFLISARGFVVLSVTSMDLDYGVSEERVSTGIHRLDHMLGGGLFRGSNALVTGMSGTGKSSLGACFANAACERGEQTLLALHEESPEQVMRNMRSLGLDLRPWVESGLLRIWASRPSAYGPEIHLLMLAQLVEELNPSVVVLDGVASLAPEGSLPDMVSRVSRMFDLLRSKGITTLATVLSHADEQSMASLSSMVDTSLLLRNVESNGERNRLLFVLKSRGTAHSNQVREFVLSSQGIELVDVYVGPAGVFAGSARLTQQSAERDAQLRQAESLERHRRELRRSIAEREAHLAATQDDLIAERAELHQIDLRERDEGADTRADRSAMAVSRWSDAAPSEGERE